MSTARATRPGYLHAAVLYAVLAVASTWPLARAPATTLPLGSDDAATVPLVSAWTLWWTADRLQHGLRSYWDAPIFHPSRGAFALSEPMPLAGLTTAPLFALGATPALAHNLFLLLSLLLNGLLGFALCRALRLCPGAALAGGAMLTLLPYVHHQLGVLALVPLAGVQATLLAVLRCARRPSARRGALAGLAFATTFLLCAQYALLLLLALLACAPLLLRKRVLGRRGALAALAALLLGTALLWPLANAQRERTASYHFERSAKRAAEGSATARAWWRTPSPDLMPFPGVTVADPPYKRALFPGGVRLCLATAGAAFGLARRGRRRTTAFLIAFTAAGVLLSVFAHFGAGPLSPYGAARALVPGLAMVRSLWRAGVLAQLGVCLLAAQGLHAAFLAAIRRTRGTTQRGPRRAAFALALLAVVELWPRPQALARVPDPHSHASWLAWIRAHVPAGAAIAYLPLPDSGRVASYEPIARFMYLQAFHGRAMVNGYSSFFPPSYETFVARTQASPLGADTRALLDCGARTLVIERARAPRLQPPPPWRKAFADPELGLEAYVLP